jgi:hypothetical protein
MTGKLITLPVRVWFRSARLLTHVACGAAGRAYSLARPTPAPERRGEPHQRERREAPRVREHRDEPRHEPTAQPQPRPMPVRPLHPPFAEESVDTAPEPVHVSEEPEPVHVSEEPEPVHVSEEPELVRESAEPGAEDGAGAAVTVMEPWNGYSHMNAREVIARARQANRAELAAVRLYEARHRSRQTVLAAVDRQLKVGSGPAPA